MHMKTFSALLFMILIFNACGADAEFEDDFENTQPPPPPTEDTRAQYSVTLSLSDGIRTIQLQYGQHSNPSSQDEQMPPAPPEGSLHAFFTKDSKYFWKDFRSENSKSEDWFFSYQTGLSGPIELSWAIQSTRLPGTLILFDPDNETEVEMGSTGKVELPLTDSGNLIFEYRFDE